MQFITSKILYPWKIGVQQIKTIKKKSSQKRIFYPIAKNPDPKKWAQNAAKTTFLFLQSFVIYLGGFDLV